MIQPPYLKKGDTIGIVAPASYVSKDELNLASVLIESWGFKIVYGKNLFNRKNSFAGTDEQRFADLQEMLDDSSIRSILCARGGYGTIRIIDKLDFSGVLKDPKWIAGYSDITILHAAMQVKGVESLHAIMPRCGQGRKPDNPSFDSLRKALTGSLNEYPVKPHEGNRQGEAAGILIGGNLSVLYSLRGTQYDVDTAGKILFIEDVNEYDYHVDRMIMNLKIAGKLKNLKGLIVGGMIRMKTSSSGFGKTTSQIIMEATEEYHFPLMMGFPAGHCRPNMALILGRKVKMTVDSNSGVITF